MAFFRKLREKFHDDWCSECTNEMEIIRRQLYAMPEQRVGHYVSHDEPEYYITHLVPVERKAEIPTGMYACGIIAYRCPQCGHRAVKLSAFLPVRDEEKVEQALYFEKGELDAFLWSPEQGREMPAVKPPAELGSKRAIKTAYYN